MEFTQYKCPVCNENFKSGDDVVVCPECGAPHHRACYEQLNRCFYADRHKDGFSFEQEHQEPEQSGQQAPGGSTAGDENTQLKNRCPRCGHDNEPGALFCSRCSMPLVNGNPSGQTEGQNQQGKNPFGFDSSVNPFFDPMAGVNPDEDLGEGIKASALAKFVGKNTQYFMLVFKRIKDFGRSRFNFASFLLPGVYMLYRKMTVPGLIISLALIALNVLSSYIYMTPAWMNGYNDLVSIVQSGKALTPETSINLMGEMMIVYLPVLLSGLRYVAMAICGLFTNRWYFRHCRHKIAKIQQENPENTNKKLERAGGVNLGLAISFGAATLIIGYVCNFMLMQSGLLF